MIIIVLSLLAVSLYATKALKDFFLQKKASELKAQGIVFKNIFDALPFANPEYIDFLCKKISKNIVTIHSPLEKTILTDKWRS